MKTSAAILVEPGRPLVVDDLEIPRLQPGQVLVEVHYSSVCHTQLLEWGGHRGHDPYLPHCLGHEGSGVVAEVGPGVTKVRDGDRVILSWLQGSGHNVPGCTYRWGSRQVNAGAITTFSQHAVVSENRLTALTGNLSMSTAAFLGCAMATGMGAVFNTAGARPGQSVAVFGAGGVGLCAVAGAAISGCAPVIAVDPLAQRLDLASRLGATNRLDPTEGDPVEAIRRLCPGGVDIAIEASGRPAVMGQALACVRGQGGVAVVVGNARQGESLVIDPKQLNQGKQLRGCWGGDSYPDRDFPRYTRLVEHGAFDPRPIQSTPYRLEQINEALAALEQGGVGRPLIALREE